MACNPVLFQRDGARVLRSVILLMLYGAMPAALTVHELGHFVLARAAGMKVEKVKLFFGRELVRWRMGGTELAIGWLPLGAYTSVPGAFTGKHLMRRGVVVAAGPLASATAALVSTWLLHYGVIAPSAWLVMFTAANAGLALLSLSPITGADSPALIGMIADHWFLGTAGRIVLALFWTVLPIGTALLLHPLRDLMTLYW